MTDASQVQKYINALGNGDWKVRQSAAWALRQLGDARAVEPLISALGDGNWWVRQSAAQALGQISDTRAIEPLTHTLEDCDWQVRRAAVQALGQLGDVCVVGSLIHTFGDRDKDVRWAAAQVLGQLGESVLAQAMLAVLDGKPQAVAALRDPRAVEPLIRILDDRKPYERLVAAEALRQLGDTRAIEPLIRTLGDKEKDVRQAAARATRSICEDNQHLIDSSRFGCICSEHLNRFIHRRVFLSFFEKTNYYACRTCRADQPRYETVSDVVLVLDDRTMDPSPIQQERVLYVPWNFARGIFDFNIVEIRAAASCNIEMFLVQFEEDSDPVRPWKQQDGGKLPCRVSPGCTISPADRARLQKHFETIDGTS